jgi:hypothetical protein
MQEQDLKAAVIELQAKWLKITVDELKDELVGRGILRSMRLKDSVGGHIEGQNAMVIHYLLYGMFVDMNVGRGRDKSQNRETAMVNRLYAQTMGKRQGRMQKRYMWYSKRMAKEQNRLAELLAALYADAGAAAITYAMPVRLEFLY